MDRKLYAATKKLASGTGLMCGAGKNKIIVYILDDFIPNFIPVNYEGYVVEVKKIGRIMPA